MSWLPRSLAGTLRPDDLGGAAAAAAEERSHGAEGRIADGTIVPDTPTHGVKEDLSELTETLSRQFRGVASFLAPPSPPPPPPPPPLISSSPPRRSRKPDPAEIRAAGGIRSDFDEIAGSFRSGISRFSNHAAVSEFSKVASNFLTFGSEAEKEEEEEEEEEDEEEEDEKEWTYDVRAFGVTDEVMAFVTNISMHPETWLDFPLFYEFEDCEDFYMSDAQQEHAVVVEHLAPRLAALRIELCPNHMSEGCFWKIYFILLHSRLNKHDAEQLSTPQLVEARAMLQRLQNQIKTEREIATKEASYRSMDDRSRTPVEPDTVSAILYESTLSIRHESEEATSTVSPANVEREKHSFPTTDVKTINKSVAEEMPSTQPDNLGEASRVSTQDFDEDDDWLEESGEMGVSGAAALLLVNIEEVSFSDLEDDDDQSMPVSSRTPVPCTDFQSKDRKHLVQLNKGTIDQGNTRGSTTAIMQRTIGQLNFDNFDDV